MARRGQRAVTGVDAAVPSGPVRSRWARAGRRCGLGLLGALVLIALAAGPAQAHSTLQSTSPAQGEQVSLEPSAVVLHFNEDVGINAASLSVLDPDGHRVDSRRPYQPPDAESTVEVRLPPGLPHASYAVVWRVVSADGHPVSGTFSFGLAVPAGAVPAQVAADPVTGVLHAIATLAAYLGAVLLIGVASFLLMVWPDGIHAPRPRGLLRIGWWLSAGSAVVIFLLQGPFGAGLGVGDVADPGLLEQTLMGRVGLLMLFRVFVLGLAVAAGPWPGEESLGALRRDAAGLGVLFLPTFSLAGHSGEGPLAPVSVFTDAVHLGAAGVWLGGLAVLLSALTAGGAAHGGRAAARSRVAAPTRPDPGMDRGTTGSRGMVGSRGTPTVLSSHPPGDHVPGGPVLAASELRRWSGVAIGSVTVLVATGTFQAWREVGTPAALGSTGYGRLLLLKLAGIVLLLVLGDQGRRWVSRLSTRPSRPWRLQASVAAELAIGTAVLAVTTLLVGTQPARQSFAAPFSATVTGRGIDGSRISVVIDVSSTRAGVQRIALTAFRPGAAALSMTAASGRLTPRSARTGPLRFAFAPVGPGRAVAERVVVPAAGTWLLTVDVQTDALTDYSATVGYDVQ